MSPSRAIQSATVEPARFLGREHWAGTIQPDRVVDFIVLDANPLDDIRNTRGIHAVVVDGRYIGPQERDGLLATAKQISAEQTAS